MDIEAIENCYREAFAFFDPARKRQDIHVSFYPYVGINHTIRVRDSIVLVRIGEICLDMPVLPHRGLAYILVGKLLRKRIPKGARDVYAAYIKTPEVRDRATRRKLTQGRKVVTSAKGHVYDLDEMFDRINRDYFRPHIPKPVLTWSARKTFRILGHHDAVHDHIAISRSLDASEVPRYVVEFVLFHEMLHIAHPTRHAGSRRMNHTAAFKADERKFAYYERAERWIEQNVRRLKRAAKKK